MNAAYPALKKTWVSPVRNKLLARSTQIIDDNKTEEYLELEGVTHASQKMLPGALPYPLSGTHLSAVGTSIDELLSSDVWGALTRKNIWYSTIHLLKKTVWCAVGASIPEGITLFSATAARGARITACHPATDMSVGPLGAPATQQAACMSTARLGRAVTLRRIGSTKNPGCR